MQAIFISNNQPKKSQVSHDDSTCRFVAQEECFNSGSGRGWLRGEGKQHVLISHEATNARQQTVDQEWKDYYNVLG
jgi:hypothetical protein